MLSWLKRQASPPAPRELTADDRARCNRLLKYPGGIEIALYEARREGFADGYNEAITARPARPA